MYVKSFLLAGFMAAIAVAAPAPAPAAAANGTACTNPQKRVEYRSLTADQKKQYTDAVLCMTKKPTELGINPETSRWDDFVYVHAIYNWGVHFVAQFLPWHRLFVSLYEKELRLCGFEGPLPYWDWTLDVADMPNSSIWDAEGGVGGNGVAPPGYSRNQDILGSNVVNGTYFCVQDGPFANMQVGYRDLSYTPHCLSRNFNSGIAYPGDMNAFTFNPASMKEVMSQPTYDEFRQLLEGLPHGAIHSAVGGDMGPASSPNDPVFYLHHVQIDRLWVQWQQQSPDRVNEYNGRRTRESGPDGTMDSGLDDIIMTFGIAPDVKVADLMSTQGDLFCYEYV